ncbi:pre-mRNA-splicing factor ATP-dependent RNA helicase PRP43, partial [Mariannaea sp. PMI_226]
GRIASQCSMDPIWYHAIEIASKMGCAMDMLDIAVLCNTQKPIVAHLPRLSQVADVSMGVFTGYPSDHLALANAFDHYMRIYDRNQKGNEPKVDLGAWCSAHFLNIGALEEARKTRTKLGQYLASRAKMPPTRASMADKTSVQKALATAFCTRLAIYHGGADEYRTAHDNVAATLEPRSSLLGSNCEWVVFTTLNKSAGKVYLKIATAVKAEWLVDLPYFQEDRLPLKGDGKLRQEKVKKSLDAAKVRIAEKKDN